MTIELRAVVGLPCYKCIHVVLGTYFPVGILYDVIAHMFCYIKVYCSRNLGKLGNP